MEWEVQERPNLLADGAEMLELDVVEVKLICKVLESVSVVSTLVAVRPEDDSQL